MIGAEAPGVRIPGGEEHLLLSEKNGREYRVLIARPADPPPPGGYPIICTLDGDATFFTLAEAVRLQTRKPHGYDPAVVVGIGYPSGEPFDMTRRCFDFTISAEEGTLPVRPDGRPWPESGGADRFLDFLEFELLPYVGARFEVDSARRTIFGHSLGGLFVLHALFARTELFANYAAGSPSIWWGNHAILKELERFADEFGSRVAKERLLLTIGAEELEDMVADSEALIERLRPLSKFRASFVKFAEEEHTSVLPAALSRVVKFALAGEPATGNEN